MLKQKKTSTNRKLLTLTLEYGLDLWLIDQVFDKTKGTEEEKYLYYNNLWLNGVYLSRIRMQKDKFNEVLELMERYKKENV